MHAAKLGCPSSCSLTLHGLELGIAQHHGRVPSSTQAVGPLTHHTPTTAFKPTPESIPVADAVYRQNLPPGIPVHLHPLVCVSSTIDGDSLNDFSLRTLSRSSSAAHKSTPTSLHSCTRTVTILLRTLLPSGHNAFRTSPMP
jgi:hypothetical protein